MRVTSNLNCGSRSAKGFKEAAFVVRRSCDRIRSADAVRARYCESRCWKPILPLQP